MPEIDVFVTFFCSAFLRLPLFVRLCSERAVKLEDDDGPPCR